MLLLFLGATLVASLTPGPVVLLTIAVSIRSGVGAALRAICGICVGSLSYLAVSLAGLLAAVVAHRAVFHAIQVLGALYLAYLGLRMLGSGMHAGERVDAGGRNFPRPFVDGLVTQLSNPKAILYWTALLPPFIDPIRPVAPQLLVLLAIGIAVDIVVLGAYALGAASVRRWMLRPQFQRWLSLTAGALFLIIGALLAFTTIAAFRGG
ncbi:MAG TPA: LysE family translocator [Steroidobacteraceae bacterium]|nr:LysE family translocator [Steroidobacteraceae bacterium]